MLNSSLLEPDFVIAQIPELLWCLGHQLQVNALVTSAAEVFNYLSKSYPPIFDL